MKKFVWKGLCLSPAIFAVAVGLSNPAIALETSAQSHLETAATEPVPLAQVTRVSDLSDVQPGDWAFSALQRLVEAYGCLDGYGDRTYRSNLAMSRYEFAAGLNACLDVVIPLIGDEPDIETLRRLQDEFATELGMVRDRIARLEGGMAALEAKQFSTNLILDLAYLAEASHDNHNGLGLLNNDRYIAQLNLLTDGLLDAAVVYLDGDQETRWRDGMGPNEQQSHVKSAYTVAGLLSLDFGRFVLAGHYAHSPAEDVEGDLDSYMGGVSFPGLLGQGNELGIYGGISPAIDRDPLLLEAYYKLNLNEFFTFTPALIYTDNDSDVGGDDRFYGSLRATLSF